MRVSNTSETSSTGLSRHAQAATEVLVRNSDQVHRTDRQERAQDLSPHDARFVGGGGEGVGDDGADSKGGSEGENKGADEEGVGAAEGARGGGVEQPGDQRDEGTGGKSEHHHRHGLNRVDATSSLAGSVQLLVPHVVEAHLELAVRAHCQARVGVHFAEHRGDSFRREAQFAHSLAEVRSLRHGMLPQVLLFLQHLPALRRVREGSRDPLAGRHRRRSGEETDQATGQHEAGVHLGGGRDTEHQACVSTQTVIEPEDEGLEGTVQFDVVLVRVLLELLLGGLMDFASAGNASAAAELPLDLVRGGGSTVPGHCS
eukprot:Hpha_TRINITY_DN15545_c0_g1::TRINITY_DN15545_c0_g1_i3::g.103949::m.103949